MINDSTRRTMVGLRRYAMILLALAHGPGTDPFGSSRPMTVARLSERVGLQRPHVSRIVTRMHNAGLLHVSDWLRSRLGFTRVYAFCPGAEDAPRPIAKKKTPSGRKMTEEQVRAAMKPRAEITGFVSIIKALAREPMTIAMLEEETGYSHSAIRRLMRHMHEARGVRIAAWHAQEVAGGRNPAYQLWGYDKADAKRPPPKSRREVNRQYAQNVKARRQMLDISFALAGASHQRSAGASA